MISTISFSQLGPSFTDNEALINEIRNLAEPDCSGEMLTAENLHLLNNSVISGTAKKLKAFVNEHYSSEFEISRMWGMILYGGEEKREMSWHNHLCDLTGVFYLQVQDSIEYPEGHFGILTPEPIFIKPQNNLLITFDHTVYHDVVPVKAGNVERISIIVDFDTI